MVSPTPREFAVPDRHVYYSQQRENIRTGDLLCWRVTKITSLFTLMLYFYQRFLKARYSHVAVALRFGGEIFAVEATRPHVRMMPLRMLPNFCHYALDVPDQPHTVRELTRHLGKRYGLLDLLKNMLQLSTDDQELYCSEMAFTFYESLGYFVDVDITEDDDELITPDALTRYVVQQSGARATFVRIDSGNLYPGYSK